MPVAQIVVGPVEVPAIAAERRVPGLWNTRGAALKYPHRHMDGTDDGSEDERGTDRCVSRTWARAVQRPFHQGFAGVTCRGCVDPFAEGSVVALGVGDPDPQSQAISRIAPHLALEGRHSPVEHGRSYSGK